MTNGLADNERNSCHSPQEIINRWQFPPQKEILFQSPIEASLKLAAARQEVFVFSSAARALRQIW